MDMHAIHIIASRLSCRAYARKFSKIKSYDPKLITESCLLRVENNPSCSPSGVYGWPDFLCSTNGSTKDSPTAGLGIHRTGAR